MRYLFILIVLAFSGSHTVTGQDVRFIKRTISSIPVTKTELTGDRAFYRPVFGAGDSLAQALRGISRYGYLSVDSAGSTGNIKYTDEEQVLFILEGTGLLNYGGNIIPVTRNDFIYIPVGVKYGMSNPRGKTIKVVVMGFKIPDVHKINKTPHLMIANSDEVKFQVLGQHGPTTQFQLLMGTTESKRDRLAAAYQVNSLFIMDFAAGGTNIPHRHANEEEIYFVLRGTGEMVAGENSEGKEMRFPVKEGDAFYFSPNTLIGFYSATKEGEEHARILAVRSKVIDAATPGK
jgi:mannose-6-phosphate isomerase-like protein (cupin superfamily)